MGRKYRGGNNPEEKYERVHKDDVEKMLLSSYWQVVSREKVVTDNLHIPEVKQIMIPATPSAGIVPPRPAPRPLIEVLDDEQFKPAEDATDIENETSTPTGKRKPGRPKKNA